MDTGRLEGGACEWLCDNKQGSSNKNSLTLCSGNAVHDMEDSVVCILLFNFFEIYRCLQALPHVLDMPRKAQRN